MQRALTLLGALLITAAAHAATPQKVAFLGDDTLYAWQNSGYFAQQPGWVGYGFSTSGSYGFVGSAYMVTQMTAIIAQKPAILYVMAGASDMDILVPNEGWLLQRFATNITAIVASARKANIKVILTTVPSMPVNVYDEPLGSLLFNEWIQQFGAANNIPVVNLHDMLCGCVSATVQIGSADVYLPEYGAPNPLGPLLGDLAYEETLTPAGFQLLTSAAQTAIAASTYALGGGYLSDVALRPDEGNPLPQQNAVPIGTTVQFTPQAYYNGGPTLPMINTTLNGIAGTWVSSNPNVMAIDQDGLAFALSVGQATINFRTLAGLNFSPWVMYVQAATTTLIH